MVLVTGGAGFIGSHLAQRLNAIVLDDFSEGKRVNTQGLICIRADIRKPKTLKAAFDGQVAVFHFAAMADVREDEKKPDRAFETNVRGTIHVLEACRKADVPRFVFASSSAVYGETASRADENAPVRPQSTYGATKSCAESFVSAYASLYGIKSTVLRFANIYGPRSTRGVMYDFVKKLKTNPLKLEILGNGKQSKSYVFVTDAADAVLLAFKKQKCMYDTFNVGANPQSADAVAKNVCTALHLKPAFVHTGGKTGWRGDVAKTWLDSSKLEKMGWTPAVSLHEGVHRYVDWLCSEEGCPC